MALILAIRPIMELLSVRSLPLLSSELEKPLRLSLHLQSRVLMRLAAGDSGDALNEVEDAGGRAAFFGEDGLDDGRRLGFREAALPQEIAAVFVGPGDGLLARRLDAVDEGHGR